jgi:hypothetical protein
MLIRYKTSDCPDADGREPRFGEQKWTLTFPLEGGDDYVEVEIGQKGRAALLAMLKQEEEDDRADGA